MELEQSLALVGGLVGGVGPDQWSASTPCTDWTVRQLVNHLVGMNRVFAAMLVGEQPPPRGDDRPVDELAGAYQDSAAALVLAFAQPGVLDRKFRSPMGVATGSDRLEIRLYDLLAHGWDLSRATGLPVDFPDDVAERALTFVRKQLSDETRPGRFAPAQIVPDDSPAIERLVAFLGRSAEEPHPSS